MAGLAGLGGSVAVAGRAAVGWGRGAGSHGGSQCLKGGLAGGLSCGLLDGRERGSSGAGRGSQGATWRSAGGGCVGLRNRLIGIGSLAGGPSGSLLADSGRGSTGAGREIHRGRLGGVGRVDCGGRWGALQVEMAAALCYMRLLC